MRFTLKEAAALTSQRVLGAWEKLRRAVARMLVAETAARDLLLQAKHLVFAAIVARVAGAISCGAAPTFSWGANAGAADAPGAWGSAMITDSATPWGLCRRHSPHHPLTEQEQAD